MFFKCCEFIVGVLRRGSQDGGGRPVPAPMARGDTHLAARVAIERVSIAFFDAFFDAYLRARPAARQWLQGLGEWQQR